MTQAWSGHCSCHDHLSMGHTTVVKLSLDRNANLDLKDERRQTPFLGIVAGGHEVVEKLLSDRNVNADFTYEKEQSLLWVVGKRAPKAVAKNFQLVGHWTLPLYLYKG